MHIIRTFRHFIAALLVTAGAGTALAQDATVAAEPPAEAVVIFYRQADDGGAAYNITMRNSTVVQLKAGNYASFRLQPGKHYIMADPKSDQVFTLDAEPGKVYHLRALPGDRATLISSKRPVLQPASPGEFDAIKAQLADVSPAASNSAQANR